MPRPLLGPVLWVVVGVLAVGCVLILSCGHIVARMLVMGWAFCFRCGHIMACVILMSRGTGGILERMTLMG